MAYMWLNIASANNGETSTSGLRDVVADKMTLSQIAEAQKLAREWMAKHPSN